MRGEHQELAAFPKPETLFFRSRPVMGLARVRVHPGHRISDKHDRKKLSMKMKVQHEDGRIETWRLRSRSRSWKVSNWTELSAQMGWSTFSQKTVTTTAGAQV